MLFRMRHLAAGLLVALSAWAQADYTFSDGGRKTAYLMSTEEVFSRASSLKAAKSAKKLGSGKIYSMSVEEMKNFRADRAERVGAMPIFYAKGDLPTAEKLAAMTPTDRAKRMEPARRLLTNKLMVRMNEARYAELASTMPIGMEKSLIEGWMYITFADSFSALDAADWMTKNGNWEFTPIFARKFFVRQTLRRQVNDPLYPKQWHLTGGGLTIGMGDAWDQVTGKGINVAVIDDGLEIGHEDLTNAFPLSTNYHRNFGDDGAPNDPTPLDPKDSHGTYCGGLAIATGFNNRGTVGVAPEARAMGLRYVGVETAKEDDAGIALAWQPTGIITHVSSNSWGPSDNGKSAGRIGSIALAGMEAGTTKNRNGLGTVYAISAGNGRAKDDDDPTIGLDDNSYDEFSTSRFAIAVAALARDGKQSSYSESGIGVAITAFGGEFQPPAVLWSTNRSGPEAFAIKAEKFPSTEAPMNYTDAGNGTSAAAPQVAGAAALLLEKNSRLGYRDVKEILMKSATKTGLQGTDGFEKNAGGFSFSHAFGAGLLNVAEALKLAANWTNLGTLNGATGTAADIGEIEDGEGGAIAAFPVAAAELRVEHVEVKINVKHAKRGDLRITIISPAGTKRIAQPRPNDDNADFTDYLLTTPHFWGESSNGEWQVLIEDTVENGVGGKFVDATIRIYGATK